MKVGIAGFSGSGKSTVFHWLTGAEPDPAKAQRLHRRRELTAGRHGLV
jgi:ABC-type glutathione transport system ATPase component